MTFSLVYHQALRCLARRAYGQKELFAKLTDQGHEEEVVSQVIDRCLELGYLDDATLASQRAHYRLTSCRQGPLRIRAELRHKGMDEETIRQALTTSLAEVDLVESAREALQSRFGRAQEDDTEQDRTTRFKQLRRQYDFLARRGFPPDIIQRVLKRDFTD
ncbi:MAG: regulatory protein RecX [Magnetococcales bacterium]|nr:regulatory protein RecX [Magnetococcales bacterium]